MPLTTALALIAVGILASIPVRRLQDHGRHELALVIALGAVLVGLALVLATT